MCSESSWLSGFTDSREEDAMAGMLWCEQWWTLLPALSDSCSSAREQIKWSLSVTWLHTICFHINWLHPRWKWTKHPFQNMKSRQHKCSWVVACSCSFTCYSCHAISGVELASIASVTHQSCPITATRCRVAEGGKWERRCFPGKVQQLNMQDWKNNCL